MTLAQFAWLIAISLGCAAISGVLGGSVLMLIRHFNPHAKD
jgi:hypothetical protein